MSILVVGSVALDTVETPFGKAERVLGGSANFFAAAASLFGRVQVVGVVGDDYPLDELTFLTDRGVDISGVERVEGESFFWAGRYDYDLNSRDTLETRLGVFADFRPVVPEGFRDARFVFLGNIHPSLQLDVLDQVHEPELVFCDTMNYWIEGNREELVSLLSRVDVLLVNDAEARQLAQEPNLLLAARWIQARGPRHVVVKKGEHGAILYAPDWVFFAPGYPLDEVYDPTGAGDAFAGGFVGYLSGSGEVDRDELRRAMIYGSATGSYAVERFSIDRFRDLTALDVAHRVEEFREMTAFEHELEEFARV
ncbi:MAG: PfkB family carbohydrate kinase [Gemmatimonadota bacterium]|jgi:sugar/nucleoside kinase (ribokinase family)